MYNKNYLHEHLISPNVFSVDKNGIHFVLSFKFHENTDLEKFSDR